VCCAILSLPRTISETAPTADRPTWATATRDGLASVRNELFPAEQAPIVQLLVECVNVQEEALDVRIRAEGLASLVGELRQESERKAA
jgi:site-specific DNA recombinase